MAVTGKRVGTAGGAKRRRINTATKIAGYDVVVKVSGMGAISAAVRDYTTDPYFVKKAEAAKEVIEKIGLPKKKYVTE